jgi:hypothetical protein
LNDTENKGSPSLVPLRGTRYFDGVARGANKRIFSKDTKALHHRHIKYISVLGKLGRETNLFEFVGRLFLCQDDGPSPYVCLN